ncbi:NAD(P)/FAD-dependent oxidoreductase [Motiliproteus sp. MSK22-1]|uniref:flavin-dependent monooxygenase QhpG n=1 Tax=Motiliproteus sp. MSK22-1 TaxID=1897630 RepID=UPI000975F190|nr:lycopene cyclase family protein [Motiliproteus sp. MSK22-1]OMH26713.1 hypothetical protein BGP75_22920 [Motiliproteus sp. MSK22-1]
MDTSQLDIMVLGGGPAGAATALGLVQLGYRVGLATESRPFAAMEGISQRVIDGLRGAGLHRALATLPEASSRQVTWNGSSSSANQETLVDRQRFDLAILEDLRQGGVEVFEARVSSIKEDEDGWSLSLQNNGQNHQLTGRFMVEARGRSAPAMGITKTKGPDTLSLLQYWQGPCKKPFSAVESFEEGWAWMAAGKDGRRYLQLTLDAKSIELPSKAELPRFCEARFRHLKQAVPFIEDAVATDQVLARTSASVLYSEVIGKNWIRVGDAAMAVDPLSGNGIFQALSSALIAPAVVNSLLKDSGVVEIAQQFYQDRVSTLFYRFARIGRDFYKMETGWANQAFWQLRSAWPDSQEVHATVEPGSWRIEHRPVVDQGMIRMVEVLVTPDQPLGIWHLQGIELASVMKVLAALPDNPTGELERVLGFSRQQAEQVYRWVQSQDFF